MLYFHNIGILAAKHQPTEKEGSLTCVIRALNCIIAVYSLDYKRVRRLITIGGGFYYE